MQEQFKHVDFLTKEEVDLFNDFKEKAKESVIAAKKEEVAGSLLYGKIIQRLNLYENDPFIDEDTCSVMIRE